MLQPFRVLAKHGLNTGAIQSAITINLSRGGGQPLTYTVTIGTRHCQAKRIGG